MSWPFEIDSAPALRRLAARSLRAEKLRVAALAILLCALLFTGVFTVAMNLNAAYELSLMRAMCTRAHAGLKNVTIEDYEELASDPRWAGAGYSIFAGEATGDAFVKLNTEVRWADEFYAETAFALPARGHMPEDEDELATSTLVLRALSVPDELGERVPLTFETDGGTVTRDFTLCGVWEGDPAAGAQFVWLSRAYTDQVAPARHDRYAGDGRYTGCVSASFNLDSAWQLEARAGRIFEEHGLGDEFHFNPVYTTSNVDLSDLLPVLGAAALVLAAGYLLIYNIFYISIAQDIRFYGLLKTLGATSKQLRSLVYRKALRLSALSIPPGLALGWLVGTALTPVILGNTTLFDARGVHSAHPLIFLAGAVFALLTVFASCRKSASTAARVSPMEALRYSEVSAPARASRRAGVVDPLRMALCNLSRGRRRVALVALSLALSLVILNSVASFAGSFDFEAFVSATLRNDFAVAEAGVIHRDSSRATLSAIDGELRAQIVALPGLEGMGNIYCGDSDQPITPELEGILRDAGQHEEVAKSPMYQYALGNMEGTNDYFGAMTYTLYGLDDYAARELKLLEGELDWERWRAGEGVFITPAALWGGKYCLYHPGDRMPIDFTEFSDPEHYDWSGQAGRTIATYEVLAVVEFPSAYGCGYATGSGTRIVLPESEFLARRGDAPRLPMMCVFDVDDAHLAEAEAFLEDYTNGEAPALDYRSMLTERAEYRDFIRMFALVGGAMCALLGLIGVLNFVNSMATSVLTRRRELAMLQAVGMTGRQLRRMLVFEGLGYAALGIGLGLGLCALVNLTLLRALMADMWAFRARFTLLPALLAVPPLLTVTALVPWLCHRGLSRATLVDRLRAAE